MYPNYGVPLIVEPRVVVDHHRLRSGRVLDAAEFVDRGDQRALGFSTDLQFCLPDRPICDLLLSETIYSIDGATALLPAFVRGGAFTSKLFAGEGCLFRNGDLGVE